MWELSFNVFFGPLILFGLHKFLKTQQNDIGIATIKLYLMMMISLHNWNNFPQPLYFFPQHDNLLIVDLLKGIMEIIFLWGFSWIFLSGTFIIGECFIFDSAWRRSHILSFNIISGLLTVRYFPDGWLFIFVGLLTRESREHWELW